MGRKITDITNSKNDNPTVYPRGYVVDAAGVDPGSTVGEPMVGDILQFFAKLSADASVILNSLPDNETNGYQLFTAFIDYIRNVLTATTTASGTVEKATTAEGQAGTIDKFIDAALFQLITSTTTRNGVVEKATPTELLTGVADKNVTSDLLGGTAWQTPSYNVGFSAGSVPLTYRISNNKLQFRGDMISTVASGIAFNIPAQYRPTYDVTGIFFSGTTIERFFIRANGNVDSGGWNTVVENSFNSINIKD